MTPEEEKTAKKKAQQAAAHKKWRESEKGKAYYQNLKMKNALSPEPETKPETV